MLVLKYKAGMESGLLTCVLKLEMGVLKVGLRQWLLFLVLSLEAGNLTSGSVAFQLIFSTLLLASSSIFLSKVRDHPRGRRRGGGGCSL